MNSRRVLIVDTEAAGLKYLAYAIKKAGHETFTASSGKEGLIAAWRERPHVLIIDPLLPDIELGEMVQKLRKDRRTASRTLVAFSSLSNPQEIQDVINLDFDHYVPKESDALPTLLAIIAGEEVAESEASLRPEQPFDLKPREASGPQEGISVVFLSAKGGTGTSSLCANLAAVFARELAESRVALIDLVLPIGSTAHIVGYDEALNVIEVAARSGAETAIDRMQERLPRIRLWGFRLLAGSPDPEAARQLDVSHVPILLNTLRRQFDFVFVDLGTSLSRISLPVILSADQVVLILSPDESTVRLTKTVLGFLQSKGLREEQVYPLINRAVGLEGLTKAQIEEELGMSIPVSIPHMGGNFALANNLHEPVTYKFPDDAASLALHQAAEEIRERAETVRRPAPSTA